MKFAFIDTFAKASSFVELCDFAKRYGFEGIEISDAEMEKNSHSDSIFRSALTSDSKRKLVNRHIEIPVLNFPTQINSKESAEKLIKYVDYAALVGVDGVVICLDQISKEEFKVALTPALVYAEKFGPELARERMHELAGADKYELHLLDLFLPIKPYVFPQYRSFA